MTDDTASGMFLYWCDPCGAWWNAAVSADEAELLRRRQRSSLDKPGTWQHPGLASCPACGQPSTQHLPTEHTVPSDVHRKLEFSNRDSERFSAGSDSQGVQILDMAVALPVLALGHIPERTP